MLKLFVEQAMETNVFLSYGCPRGYTSWYAVEPCVLGRTVDNHYSTDGVQMSVEE